MINTNGLHSPDAIAAYIEVRASFSIILQTGGSGTPDPDNVRTGAKLQHADKTYVSVRGIQRESRKGNPNNKRRKHTSINPSI